MRFVSSAICLLTATQTASAQSGPNPSEPFEQETVEIRSSRNPLPASQRKALSGAHHHRRHGPSQESGAHNHRHGSSPVPEHQHAHGIETENLFGFTLGSDTEHAQARGIAIETIGRFGKRDGRYNAVGSKLEFAYGITDNLSAAFGLFGSYHDISGIPGFDKVRGGDFNGVGGELRWRLEPRSPTTFGITLHLEPSWQTHDELTGLKGTKFGSENKLIFDRELVPEKLFAAFNLLYELEHVREDGASEAEKASKVGVAAAMSAAIVPNFFIGGEARYLRAYKGILPETFAGDGWYLGPTLFARLGGNAWVSAAWNVLVAGREVGVAQNLDLTNFERHQLRLKVGVEF